MAKVLTRIIKIIRKLLKIINPNYTNRELYKPFADLLVIGEAGGGGLIVTYS
jgi:hypothetical protein